MAGCIAILRWLIRVFSFRSRTYLLVGGTLKGTGKSDACCHNLPSVSCYCLPVMSNCNLPCVDLLFLWPCQSPSLLRSCSPLVRMLLSTAYERLRRLAESLRRVCHARMVLRASRCLYPVIYCPMASTSSYNHLHLILRISRTSPWRAVTRDPFCSLSLSFSFPTPKPPDGRPNIYGRVLEDPYSPGFR